MKNFLPKNTDGAMTPQERQEQLLTYIASIRSEVKALSKQVNLVKTIERAILGFIVLGMTLGIIACINFAQT